MPIDMIRQVTGREPIEPVEAFTPATEKALPFVPSARMTNTSRQVAMVSQRKLRQLFAMAGIVQKVPRMVSGWSAVAL